MSERENVNVNVRKVREFYVVQLVLLLSINNGLMTSAAKMETGRPVEAFLQ